MILRHSEVCCRTLQQVEGLWRSFSPYTCGEDIGSFWWPQGRFLGSAVCYPLPQPPSQPFTPLLLSFVKATCFFLAQHPKHTFYFEITYSLTWIGHVICNMPHSPRFAHLHHFLGELIFVWSESVSISPLLLLLPFLSSYKEGYCKWLDIL